MILPYKILSVAGCLINQHYFIVKFNFNCLKELKQGLQRVAEIVRAVTRNDSNAERWLRYETDTVTAALCVERRDQRSPFCDGADGRGRDKKYEPWSARDEERSRKPQKDPRE
jgi:CDGSH-type Zn-finger protein